MPLERFNRVNSVLNTVAHSYGLDVRFWEYRLQTKWASIVGTYSAAHTQPDRIKFGKLQLLVENSLWLQQLVFLKPLLIEKINTAAGKPLITDIIFRLGEWGEEQSETDSPEQLLAVAPMTPESLVEASYYTTCIKNPDLRHSLTQVMAKALMAPSTADDPTGQTRR